MEVKTALIWVTKLNAVCSWSLQFDSITLSCNKLSFGFSLMEWKMLCKRKKYESSMCLQGSNSHYSKCSASLVFTAQTPSSINQCGKTETAPSFSWVSKKKFISDRYRWYEKGQVFFHLLRKVFNPSLWHKPYPLK